MRELVEPAQVDEMSEAAEVQIARVDDRVGGSSQGAPRPIPPKQYRIGEVAEYSGVSRQTIHNYTAMGLLRETRWTRGGHRLYDERVFARLDQIASFKRDSKSMEDIRLHFSRLDRE